MRSLQEERGNESWNYESGAIPIQMRTIPDFTCKNFVGDTQVVVELKGQANSSVQRKLLATATSFDDHLVSVTIPSGLPEELQSRLKEIVADAEKLGYKCRMTQIPKSVYIVVPLVKSLTQRTRYMNNNVKSGWELDNWLCQNGIISAPATNTDFSLVHQKLNEFKFCLTNK